MYLALRGPAAVGPLRQGISRDVYDSRHSTRLPKHGRRGQALIHAAVGIDLGTSNSAIGFIHEGEAKVVKTIDGSTTSSWVAFTEVRLADICLLCQVSLSFLSEVEGLILQKKVLVGSEARRQSQYNPENSFSSVKRLIGTVFDTVSAELQYAPYKAQGGPDGLTLLWCPARSAQHWPVPTP